MLTFSDSEKSLVADLISAGQSHLFAGFGLNGCPNGDEPAADSAHALLDQLARLNRSYPGGIAKYVSNGKKLLEDSAKGVNPFEGLTPEVPAGERLQVGNEKYLELEAKGVELMGHTAFVLVAGGLGERLGYKGIKVALPSDIVTGKCFLQLYIEQILAYQQRSGTGRTCELAIMTSDDTHKKTAELLDQHQYFGMSKEAVHLIKQEKVPCLGDNNGSISVNPDNRFEILTKPHGHGDVHSLLHQSGLAQKWKEGGVKYVVFFQDTNGLGLRILPAAIAVSSEKGFAVNSITVPRRAKEAVGAITRLVSSDKSVAPMTVNVEYNQLDPLLRATVSPEGDVNDESGFSPFPGNINQLIFSVDEYVEALDVSSGSVPEFVNPKYADETRTKFKSPARLECMMQDFAKVVCQQGHNAGFCQMEDWAAFNPVKNNTADAVKKQASGNDPASAASAEDKMYQFNAKLLRMYGAKVEEGAQRAVEGVNITDGPRIIFSPSFAPTVGDIKAKLSCPDVRISAKSTLVIGGSNVSVKSLDLDGALFVHAAPASTVEVNNLVVKNDGWMLEDLKQGEEVPEELKIRGYKLSKNGERIVIVEEAGTTVVSQ